MKKIINVLLCITLLFATVMQTVRVFAEEVPNIASVSTRLYTLDDQTKFDTGSTATVYVSATGSSETTDSPYSLVYLDKTKFNQPNSENVSTAEGLSSVEITENETHYIIRLNYTLLAAGASISVPFNAILTNRAWYKGEKSTIKTELYSKNNVLLSEDSSVTLEANTRVYYVFIAGEKYPSSGLFDVFDKDTDETHTKLSSDYIDTMRVSVSGDFYSKTLGDSRSTKIEISVPEHVIFDPTLPNNREWTYNSETKTVSMIVPTISKDEYKHVDFKYSNDFTIGDKVVYNVTRQFVNEKGVVVDDGRQVNSTDRTHQYIATNSAGIIQKQALDRKIATGDKDVRVFDEDNFQTFEWDIAWGFKDQLDGQDSSNLRVVFKSIEDSPHENILAFKGYKYVLHYKDHYDESTIAALSANKLIGILPDGTEEVIATNIKPTEATGNDAFRNYVGAKYSTIPFQEIPVKEYKTVKLVFDKEVSIPYYRQTQIHLQYQTQLTKAGHELVKTTLRERLEKGSTDPYPVINKFSSTSSVGNGNSPITDEKNKIYLVGNSANISVFENILLINGTSRSTAALVGDTVRPLTRFKIAQNRTIQSNMMEQGKVIFLVPEGLEFQEFSVFDDERLKVDTENYDIIYNYKNTGKTAYIFPVTLTQTEKDETLYMYMGPIFKATRELAEGSNSIETYLSWTNNERNGEEAWYLGSNPDELDTNDNGKTDDKIVKATNKFSFAPPKELIITKTVKLPEETQYTSGANVDGTGTANYKVSLINVLDNPVSNISIIDVLPKLDDLQTVANQDGDYLPRETEFPVTLNGPIVATENYDVYYSTDTPKQTLSENARSTWLSADQVSDFSKVTMFKAVMKQGYMLNSGNTDSLTFDVAVPSTVSVTDKQKAVNTAAYYYGNDITSAVESKRAILLFNEYTVRGTIFDDVNKDGIYNGGDTLVPERKVTLYSVSQDGTEKEIAATKTNSNGQYTFEDVVELRGNYKVKVTLEDEETVATLVPSTDNIIGTDINDRAENSFTLSPTQKVKVVNAGLVIPKRSTVTVNHVFIGNEEKNSTETKTDIIGKTYEFSPRTDVEGYELIKTEGQPKGEYVETASVVTFTYASKKTSVTVTKTWEDSNNQDGKRPETVTVVLSKKIDGKSTEVIRKELTIANQTDDNTWQYTFEELPLYEKSTKVEYTVDEELSGDIYTKFVNGYTITNTHKPEMIDIVGKKVWNDANNQDGKRPETITVRLLADGTLVSEQVIRQSDTPNEWSFTFQNQPKYKAGQEIVYTVEEVSVDGYATDITKYVITNTHTPEVKDIQGKKVWDDANNQDGKRPESITLELMNGDKVVQKQIVKAPEDNTTASEWGYQFKELPVYENGQEIAYSVREVPVKDYEATYETSVDGEITITNTHIPETIDVIGKKVWKDYDNVFNKRPESITINLKRGDKVIDTQVVKAPETEEKVNEWSYTFKDLPKYENGQEIVYSVSEEEVKGYKTEIEDYVITNTYVYVRIPDKSDEPSTPESDKETTSSNNHEMNATNQSLPKTGTDTSVSMFVAGIGILSMLMGYVLYRKNEQ
ncbi:Cna B-type domain-containing protein [Carnobacteriaceae bacterium zg-84]|uniref:Cna B-type domain-containing protein n=1 Tax=Granulicatella sp. zg-84 TaxID=2678503 RepID=UPI0013C25510|nr:Cna B-type domain-containing protein [Granulicatella sp. zg-84]NEW65599.1 Cna B-type domain-containing protein [Granulicatella sp. zg-84]QMI85757.1 Cna B-type domain-containing protein [Carnobacteriaceae bacterium zg-84]